MPKVLVIVCSFFSWSFLVGFIGAGSTFELFFFKIFLTSKTTPMGVLSAEFSTSRQAVTAKPAELNNKLVARGD